MVNRFLGTSILGLTVALALPTLGNAQDIFLASGGADLTWKGTATGANHAAGEHWNLRHRYAPVQRP